MIKTLSNGICYNTESIKENDISGYLKIQLLKKINLIMQEN